MNSPLRLALTLAVLAAAYTIIALIQLPNATTFDEPLLSRSER